MNAARGIRRRPGLTADQVASQLTYDHGTGTVPIRRRGQYRPNQSLYDGSFQPLPPCNSEDEEASEYEFNSPSSDSVTPLCGSSLFNTRARSQRPGQSTPLRQEWMPEMTVAGLIQEQQELLERVLKNQKDMQNRQEKFEKELATLSKEMTSSSTSPDSDGRSARRLRICRELTVCLRYSFVFLVRV